MAELLPVKYNVTDAALAELKSKYTGIKVTDADSYETARKGIAETRSLRVAVEEERKSLKASALDYGRRVDSEAKRITAALFAISDPLQAEKKKVDDEKERLREEKAAKEQARINAIQNRISAIQNKTQWLESKTAKELTGIFNQVFEIQIDDTFQEFKPEAERVKAEVLNTLMEAIGKREKIEAEAARLEKLRLEQEAVAKAQAEERRKIDEEKAKIDAEKKAEADRKDREEWEKQAKERAEKEARDKVEKEAAEKKAKEEADAKAKAEREAQESAEKARLESIRPDKEKLLACVDEIIAMPKPILKDKAALKILSKFSEKLADAVAYVKKEVEAL